MPLCRIALLSLKTPIPQFLQALTTTHSIQPLVASKVIKWIITPSHTTSNDLLNPPHPYTLLLILPTASPLPPDLTTTHINHIYTFTAGIPSRLVTSFASTNSTLLHPSSTLPLTGSLDNPKPSTQDTTQNLEWTPSFHTWSTQTYDPNNTAGAVSMLNLLKFKPGQAAFESYQTYGRAFASSIGKRRGGTAKLVGKILPPSTAEKGEEGNEDAKGWHELALAHYPSIRHFLDMAASKDYQEVNHEFRLPALEDTCILMTSEIAVEEEVAGYRGSRL